MKRTRLTALVLTFVLLFSCFSVLPAFAEVADGQVDIVAQNIVYGEKIQIAYAVDCSVEDAVAGNVKVDYTVDGESLEAKLWKNGEETYEGKPIFVTKGFHANQFTESVSAVAYTGAEAPADATPRLYSVAEYLFAQLYKYDFINKTAEDDNLGEDGRDFFRRNLYISLMEYGTAAQQVLDGTTGDALLSNYCYIWTAENGVTINGASSALVAAGAEVTISGANSYTSIVDGVAGEPETFNGASFTATAAGLYNFSATALGSPLTVETFEDYETVTSGTTNYGTASGGSLCAYITDVDADGDKEALIYNKNTTSNSHYTLGIKNTSEGEKYTFEMDLQVSSIAADIVFYNYNSASEVSAGTNYAFVFTIKSNGTVAFQSSSNVATIEKTLSLKEWHSIKITGDRAVGGNVSLIIDGEVWATVQNAAAISHDSFKILMPKKTDVNTTIYMDNVGFNYHD